MTKYTSGLTLNSSIKLSIFLIIFYLICSSIPLFAVDTDFLKLSTDNVSILEPLKIYSDFENIKFLIGGIIPSLNASLFLDFLLKSFPSFEKNLSEQGLVGKQKLNLYKKSVLILAAITQAIILTFYFDKTFSYFYKAEKLAFIFELFTGSIIAYWIGDLMEKRGVGNGISIIFFINILKSLPVTFFNLNIFPLISFFTQFYMLLVFLKLLYKFQKTVVNIPLISGSKSFQKNVNLVQKQESFFSSLTRKRIKAKIISHYFSNFFLDEKKRLKTNVLGLRYNQAGISPFIVSFNLITFLSALFSTDFKLNNKIFLYLSIILANYLYTSFFWNSEKISEQLRKASVALTDLSPGYSCQTYLDNFTKNISLRSGLMFCSLLIFFESTISYSRLFSLSNYISISILSLFILFNVSFYIFRKITAISKTYKCLTSTL